MAVLVLRLAGQAITRIGGTLYRPAQADRAAPVRTAKHYGPLSDSPLSLLTVVADDDLDPAVFARALQSWMAAGVREIIVLIGLQAQRCHRVLESFPVTVIRRRHDVGLDLQTGWRAARGEYVALVDPGTVWAHDVASRVICAFTDATGAVAVRQNAYHLTGLACRLGDIDADLMAAGRAAAGARLGGAVTASWERTAVFRRAVLLDIGHRFAGKNCAAERFGPRLAGLVMAAGWDVTFQRSARVWPVMSSTLRQLVSEAFAAGRDGWPALRLAGLWAGRPGTFRPYLAGCQAAMLMAGPAALIGLGYGSAALWAGAWQLAAVLAGWAVLGHAVMMLPHLRRRPSSLLVVPVHVAVAGVLDITGFAGFVVGGTGLLLRRITRAGRRASAVAIPAQRSGAQIDPALRLKPIAKTRVRPAAIQLPAEQGLAEQLVVDVAEAERTQPA